MKRKDCIILAVISLCLGLCVYLFFNQSTYIYKILPVELQFKQINCDNSVLYIFIKDYCADLLWSISFTFVVQSILMLNFKSVYWLLLTAMLGTSVEVMQLFNIINGTFDLYDIFVYLLGALISILIIKIGGQRNEIN